MRCRAAPLPRSAGSMHAGPEQGAHGSCHLSSLAHCHTGPGLCKRRPGCGCAHLHEPLVLGNVLLQLPLLLLRLQLVGLHDHFVLQLLLLNLQLGCLQPELRLLHRSAWVRQTCASSASQDTCAPTSRARQASPGQPAAGFWSCSRRTRGRTVSTGGAAFGTGSGLELTGAMPGALPAFHTSPGAGMGCCLHSILSIMCVWRAAGLRGVLVVMSAARLPTYAAHRSGHRPVSRLAGAGWTAAGRSAPDAQAVAEVHLRARDRVSRQQGLSARLERSREGAALLGPCTKRVAHQHVVASHPRP